MQTQIAYSFESAQTANRFLNTLTNWDVAYVQAKLFKGSDKVLVSYTPDEQGFDRTASELDDLAARMGGHEVALR